MPCNTQYDNVVTPVTHNMTMLLFFIIISPGVVVCRVLLACDQLLGVEELPVGAHSDLVNDGGLQVHKHGPGHMLARPSLREEGGEGVISNVRILLMTIIS